MACALLLGVWAIVSTVDTRIPTIYDLYNRAANWISDSNQPSHPMVQSGDGGDDGAQSNSADRSADPSGSSGDSPVNEGIGQ